MIYFASDFHLGMPTKKTSREREEIIIRWLSTIEKDAETIYLLGDLFDFWHEYKTVVPKGFVRFLGKLAHLSDKGIDIQVFTGNHDLWMTDYFQKELGISVFKEPEKRTHNEKSFFIGHGDGLGQGEATYKVIRTLFHHPVSQFLFKWIHPDIGMKLATYWSKQSRGSHGDQEVFRGEENEYLVQFCKEKLEQAYFDYFVFGHRHLPLEITLHEKGSKYFNLGEWFTQYNYATFDGQNLSLQQFEG